MTFDGAYSDVYIVANHRITEKMQFIFYMRRVLAHTCSTFVVKLETHHRTDYYNSFHNEY